jgi:AcrR family transcriptional regulator
VKRSRAVTRRAADTQHDAKDLLIKAGKILFSEKGLEGTTVRELAKKADVNISLVSYHFNGKEGLYRACLEEFQKRRLSAAISVLQPPESHQELHIRLEIFIDEIINSIIEEPQLNMMLHREFENKSPRGLEIFQETFIMMQDSLLTFLKTAQKQKLIRKDIDPKTATYLFFGNIAHISRTYLKVPHFSGLPPIKLSKSMTKISQNLYKIFVSGILGDREK